MWDEVVNEIRILSRSHLISEIPRYLLVVHLLLLHQNLLGLQIICPLLKWLSACKVPTTCLAQSLRHFFHLFRCLKSWRFLFFKILVFYLLSRNKELSTIISVDFNLWICQVFSTERLVLAMTSAILNFAWGILIRARFLCLKMEIILEILRA